MEKDSIKYDGIEFSQPLAVKDNHSPISIFLIALAVFVGEYFWKRKDKKTSIESFRFKSSV
jgi:hypothetical protein